MNELFAKRLDSLPDLNKIHQDFVNGSFKCLFNGDYISSSNYNNGICDCCDGTDEIENHNVVCEITCPIDIQKYHHDFYQLYLSSINNSIEMLHNSTKLKKEIIHEKKKSESSSLLLQQKYQNLSQNKKYYNNLIEKIVYDSLNETDYQKYKNDPMNKIFKIFSVLNLSDIASFKDSFKNNWKETFQKNLTKSIVNALQTQSYEYIRDIGELLTERKNIKNELKNSTYEYTEMRSIGERMMSLLESHLFQHEKWMPYGTGNITFSSINKTLQINIRNMHSITLNISGNIINFDQVSRSSDIMEFKNKNNGKMILYNICNQNLGLLNFYRIHRQIYVAVLASPVPCKTEPSLEDFVEYFRKLQFFI